jgi:hypothetical protein
VHISPPSRVWCEPHLLHPPSFERVQIIQLLNM